MTLETRLGISVNGERRQVQPGLTVAAMLRTLGIDPARVAVERNLEVIPRSSIGTLRVEDGDAFEIVRFVGGG